MSGVYSSLINAAAPSKIAELQLLLSEKCLSFYMDRRWLCAGLSALCFLASARMGWFRGLVLPMMGVGFLFAILWFWFVERMGSVAKQQELYIPTPQELAAIKRAALEKQQAGVATPIAENPVPAASIPAVAMPEPLKAPAPTGRAVFSLGQEAPKVQPKPPQV